VSYLPIGKSIIWWDGSDVFCRVVLS